MTGNIRLLEETQGGDCNYMLLCAWSFMREIREK